MEVAKRGRGRPSKYNEETQAKAEEYLLTGYLDNEGVIPSVAGLACYLGVSRSTIQDWRKEHPEFNETIEAIDVKQEHIALNGGLSGKYNSTITKLVLANHGYSDSQKVDHTSKGESVAPTSIIIQAVDDDTDS